MYQYEEDRFYGERREGGIYLLSYGVVAVEVPSLPAVTPCQKGDGKFVDADVDNNKQGSRAARSSSHPPPTLYNSCSRRPSHVNVNICCNGTWPTRIFVVIL